VVYIVPSVCSEGDGVVEGQVKSSLVNHLFIYLLSL